jgi:hypothetical protein
MFLGMCVCFGANKRYIYHVRADWRSVFTTVSSKEYILAYFTVPIMFLISPLIWFFPFKFLYSFFRISFSCHLFNCIFSFCDYHFMFFLRL